jgi:hypothetical protein
MEGAGEYGVVILSDRASYKGPDRAAGSQAGSQAGIWSCHTRNRNAQGTETPVSRGKPAFDLDERELLLESAAATCVLRRHRRLRTRGLRRRLQYFRS